MASPPACERKKPKVLSVSERHQEIKAYADVIHSRRGPGAIPSKQQNLALTAAYMVLAFNLPQGLRGPGRLLREAVEGTSGLSWRPMDAADALAGHGISAGEGCRQGGGPLFEVCCEGRAIRTLWHGAQG